ncbi:MAG: chemotaxis protein CheW, partial [Candidatus Sulfotelmatobacter sp.]
MSAERIDWAEVHRRMAAAEITNAFDGRAAYDKTKAILKERAKALARESNESTRVREILEVVTFMLGQEKYGIELRYVREVFPMNELTLLPGTPPFVLGIVNVRGQVLSVIDIRKLFDLPHRGVGELD